MPVVIKVDSHLLSRMYSIASQYWSAPSGYPHASQCIGVHLVLLYQPLTLLVYIYAAVLAMMDLVVTHYGITIGANLNPCQSISVNVIVFDKTPTLAKDVHSSLVSVVDLVLADRWIAVGGYPDTLTTKSVC